MTRRNRSLIAQGAATALLVCGNTSPADPMAAERGLPQWILRAQERLALEADQQRELRALIDENSRRLRELQLRLAGSHEAGIGNRVREELEVVQGEFRQGLESILSAEQVAVWDSLIEDLLGEVHLRNAPRVAEALH